MEIIKTPHFGKRSGVSKYKSNIVCIWQVFITRHCSALFGKHIDCAVFYHTFWWTTSRFVVSLQQRIIQRVANMMLHSGKAYRMLFPYFHMLIGKRSGVSTYQSNIVYTCRFSLSCIASVIQQTHWLRSVLPHFWWTQRVRSIAAHNSSASWQSIPYVVPALSHDDLN